MREEYSGFGNRSDEKNIPAVIGNRELCRRFCEDIRRDSLSHAYIIEGAYGTGKFTLAMNVAAAVCCENNRSSEGTLPCGNCEPCRKILNGLTPDVSVIELREDKASISIEQIRKMRESVCFSPNEMAKKVIIIKNAELMTDEAQNALLLTLEEPPEYLVFLLLTENSRGLLETVRSRAPILRMRALDDDTVREWLISSSDLCCELDRKDPVALSEIVVSAAGSIGRALMLVDPASREALREIRELTDTFVESVSQKNGMEKLLATFSSSSFKVRENVGVFLNSVITAFRDLLLLRRADNVFLCYYTDRDAATELAMTFSVASLVRYIELCENVRIDVTVSNTNIRLSLLRLLTEIFDKG